MSTNRLKLQGTVNEDARKEDRDINGLLLGFYRELLRETLESRKPKGVSAEGRGGAEATLTPAVGVLE